MSVGNYGGGPNIVDGATPQEVLVDVLKSIIDDEWGPYPDEEYAAAADQVMARLGLTEERHECAPVSVPEYDDNENPVMDERVIQPVQKHHIEWVAKRRFVTPWQEVGPRITSEQLAARLETSHD